jgi:hypothetical protein
VAESDQVLRRVERDGTIACLAMTAVAGAIARGRWAEPLGVLGGGLLVAVSYRGIKSGVEVLVAVMAGGAAGHKGIVRGLVKIFTRYAILAGAAYVIMARLRLPPVAVFAGASSIVLAVTVEALRGLRGR